MKAQEGISHHRFFPQPASSHFMGNTPALGSYATARRKRRPHFAMAGVRW